MNPRNDAAELFRQGLIDSDEYYQRDQQRIKALHAAARGFALKRDWPGEAAPDSRLLVNPNPIEKRYGNE